MTVDFATAASRNGSILQLSRHKKTNTLQKKANNIIKFLITFIFYHKEDVKQDHLLSYTITVVLQPWQNPPLFCSRLSQQA